MMQLTFFQQSHKSIKTCRLAPRFRADGDVINVICDFLHYTSVCSIPCGCSHLTDAIMEDRARKFERFLIVENDS